jgi:positive regulator of sigma E activity
MDQTSHISHQGIVLRCEGDRAYVTLSENAACQSCRAKGACGVQESDDHLYEVPAKGLAVGDRVMLEITSSTAFKSVALAYLVPFLLILTMVILGSVLQMDEGLAALSALGSIAIYYFLLALFFQKRQSHFNLNIHRI